MSTTIAKNIKSFKRQWYLVDAENQVLGRLASKLAVILMGKHRPSYTRHLDMGDHVIVINAAKVKITGTKMQQKQYRHYTGYPGGLREIPMERVMAQKPTKPLVQAVTGMLPKSALGHQQAKKLYVYADASHPHVAQKPKVLKLN